MHSTTRNFTIAVLPGDGIGTEVIGACQEVLEAVAARTGSFSLNWRPIRAGAAAYRETGTALADADYQIMEQADAILLGAMGLPDVRYPDGTEISPQLDIRDYFELYAGVRPIRAIPGLPQVLRDPRAANIDFVLVREQTEGLFYSRGQQTIKEDVAYDTLALSRKGCERVMDFALRLATQRKSSGHPGKVTWVDKANVLTSMAFARQIFQERASHFPDVAQECAYVDATALNLIRQPWNFDVIVTENMFGDILSDLSAGLVGSMGLAPSADIGDRHAMFQPAHGSAPDIAGTGKANPTATFLSGAMMLSWLGEKSGVEACLVAARLIEQAVDMAFTEEGKRPVELGGSDGTASITSAVLKVIKSGCLEKAIG